MYMAFGSKQLQLRISNSKRPSVVGRKSMCQYRLPMNNCWISLVAMPMVDGVLFCNIQHKLIPIGFCQDRCSRYGQVFAIALHDTLMGCFGIGDKPIAVDQDKFRFN
jgi:hypothetical protein